jgi:ATP-dependent DNA helicase RecQ
VCEELEGQGGLPEEAETIVRKALCGIARVQGRFGIQAAARLLCGTADERLQRAGLDQTPTFGTLSEFGEEWLLRLLRRCVTAGWADFQGGEHPVVVITEEGREVIHARRPARLLLPPLETPATEEAPAGRAKKTRRTPEGAAAVLDAAGRELFEALRAFRIETAREEQVPPYVIASDRTLRDIALLRPANLDELLLAHGIGPAKVERFGAALLKVVRRAGAGG